MHILVEVNFPTRLVWYYSLVLGLGRWVVINETPPLIIYHPNKTNTGTGFATQPTRILRNWGKHIRADDATVHRQIGSPSK